MAIVGDWKPISSAPKDYVILTDLGFAKFVDQRTYGSAVETGWYICLGDGQIPSCSYDGIDISKINPQWWMDIPLNESI